MLDFLKALFGDGEALTFDQIVEKAKAAKINAVNLADGGYISQGKHDDKVKALNEQVEVLQGQIAQRDTDMATLQEQLTAAQADASKLGEAQATLTELQGRYTTDKKDLEDKLAQQAYEFAIREKAGALSFSSSAAKKAFIQEAISKGFKKDGDTLLGYEDFVTKYKADDPGAFVAESPTDDPAGGGDQDPPPKIVQPASGDKTPAGGANPFSNWHFGGVRPKPQE